MSAKGRSRRPATKARRRRVRGPWLIATGVLALAATAAVIVFGVVSGSQDNGGGGAGQTSSAIDRLCASGRVPVDGHVCGEDSAPVKIVEFSDYQCPFCKRFVDFTEPSVETEYIEKGLVQLEFRDLAITGGNAPPDTNEATLAAEAAECANDQGRFWEYHYKLYAEQQGENRGAFLPDRLKQFASDLGLDRAEFDQCLDSHEHNDFILQERADAAEVGARATPSFLINDKLVIGYMPFEEFRQHVEEALAQQ